MFHPANVRAPHGARFLARVAATLLMALSVATVSAVQPALANEKYAGIVIDANTGRTLYDYRADSTRYPASLTKMMTLYMLFEAMKAGKVKKSTPIRFSPHAASMVPSKLGVKAGGSITAEQAILALVTKSANDAAAAVAEHLGGTESRFAEMMTAKARQLGMNNTRFRNASGLPDSRQVTTARDMARLGIALQEHFPREFAYFKTGSFTFGRTRMANHNRLLGKVRGVDGIKTGYTRASGYNLVTSVNVDGKSLVAVVIGGNTGASRNAQMEKLIAQYLPKASRRGGGQLIARTAPTDFNTPARVAGIAGIPLDRLPVPAFDRAEDEAGEPVAVAAYAPEPAPQPLVDTMTTATTGSRSGWVIQIGALESQQQALDYLRTAQDRAGKLLGNRDPFVELFVKNGTEYHRARFAGFASKTDAWNACAALKKLKYGCLATEIQ